MFRIIKAGAGIGLTENLNYIKKAENGCYILCPEHDASGIVFEGVAYHLLGRAAMDELETVSLEQTDAGSEITKATEAGGIVFVTLAEAGSIDAETAAEHADLFAECAPTGWLHSGHSSAGSLVLLHRLEAVSGVQSAWEVWA